MKTTKNTPLGGAETTIGDTLIREAAAAYPDHPIHACTFSADPTLTPGVFIHAALPNGCTVCGYGDTFVKAAESLRLNVSKVLPVVLK